MSIGVGDIVAGYFKRIFGNSLLGCYSMLIDLDMFIGRGEIAVAFFKRIFINSFGSTPSGGGGEEAYN